MSKPKVYAPEEQDAIDRACLEAGAWVSAVGILRVAGMLPEGASVELRNAQGKAVASFTNVAEPHRCGCRPRPTAS